MDFNSLLTPEVTSIIKIGAILLGVFHLLAMLIMYQYVFAVNREVRTPHGRFIGVMGLVHLLVLAGILVFIILY